MRTTINLDDELFEEAHSFTVMKERTALIERESSWPGSVPRRRPESV